MAWSRLSGTVGADPKRGALDAGLLPRALTRVTRAATVSVRPAHGISTSLTGVAVVR